MENKIKEHSVVHDSKDIYWVFCPKATATDGPIPLSSDPNFCPNCGERIKPFSGEQC